METNRFMMNIRFKLTTSQQIAFLALLWLALSPLHITIAQNITSVNPINNLHEGVLIVRFPAYKAKIDTLHAMIDRSNDPGHQQRLQKLLQETMDTRDSTLMQYRKAFLTHYNFSKSAYYFDTDARDLNTASYYTMEGDQISVGELSEMPMYYLHFERSEGSRIEAMVVYDRMNKKVPPPFPNDFAQGGINLLIVKIAEKKFPDWRVKKVNKEFWKNYHAQQMNAIQ